MQSTICLQILFAQLLVLIHLPQQSYSFSVVVPSTRTRISKVHQVPFAATNDNNDNNDNNDTGLKEAEQLLAKAKAIRTALAVEEKENESLPPRTNNNASYITETKKVLSPFNVNRNISENDGDNVNVNNSHNCESVGYRLYLDIGREDGTWMDPRWGASGKRIECSIDVSFLMPMNNDNDISLAGEEIIDQMVKDNLSGKSSNVRILQSATKARLRGGFDEMSVNSVNSGDSSSNSSNSLGISNSSGYRIDAGGNRSSSNTMRFYLNVEGTGDANSEYGDISIPEGNLYFSLPCFGNNAKQLSSKEGLVTVRQYGWHTGWRRLESRSVGVFRAVPIDQAKKRDRF